MKTMGIALALGLALAPSAAFAQTLGYFEANVGAGFVSQVNTSTYAFTYNGDAYAGHAVLNYGTSITVGGELGLAGFAGGNIRIGISYDYLDASLDSAGLIGTVNGMPQSIVEPASFIRAAGFDFDNSAHVISGNAYYNLPLIGGVIRPYAGIGVGAALIDHADSQLAISGTLGFRYALSDETYVGAKYKFFYVNGPTDDLGISYDPIMAHTISAVIGFYT